MLYLIFDTTESGHHGEFLENVVASLKPDDQCMILTVRGLRAFLSESSISKRTNVECVYLSDIEHQRLHGAKSSFQRGVIEIRILNRYIRDQRPDFLILMHLNLHQLALAFWKPPCEIKVFGILLSPDRGPVPGSDFVKRTSRKLSSCRKFVQLWLMLRQKKIERVFILNDSIAVEHLNRVFLKRPIFQLLYDPLPVQLMDQFKSPTGRDLDRETGHFTLLIAGSISPRKNVLRILDAIELLLQSQSISRIRLLVAGKARCNDYRREIVDQANRLEKEWGAHFEFEWWNRFVDYGELWKAFQSSDCVLLPYNNFTGSSGILGYACAARKPVVVSQGTLTETIVVESRLGIVVDPNSSFEIASAISKILSSKFDYDEEASAAYVSRASSTAFSESLLY